MDHEQAKGTHTELRSAFQSPTFDRDVQIRVNETVGSASISPSGRDVVLAS
jgi:WD repeat-containing protein 59